MPAVSEKRYWDEYSNLQRVKHELIRSYLNGWFPKLTLGRFGSGRVVYFDTHAGRGKHRDGKLGSPLVALNTLLSHPVLARFTNTELCFFFIEKDQENLAQLQQELKALGKLPKNVQVQTASGDCFEILDSIITELGGKGARLAPSFVFCDPFGFNVPGSPLKRLMEFPKVELFVNVIWRELDMAITHGTAGKSAWVSILDSIFDSHDWRTIDSADFDVRADQCVSLYRQMTRAKWATYIRMLGDNKKTRYFLLHLTNHDAGRELMKECMWSCCPEEGYYVRKRDDPRQQLLIEREPDLRPLTDWVTNRLGAKPERWLALHEAIRPEPWLPKHVNQVVRELRKRRIVEGDQYEGRFGPSNNPLLHLTST